MEFIAGSLITLFIVAFLYRLVTKQRRLVTFSAPLYSQSYNLQLLRPLLGENIIYADNYTKIKTQATEYFDQRHMRMVVMDDYAYWIKDNVLLCAEYGEEGFNENSTKEVDIMGMDRVELNKMITVVDKLTEGKQDDSGSSGNKKL